MATVHATCAVCTELHALCLRKCHVCAHSHGDLTERGSSRVTASMSLKSAPARRYDFHMYSK
jgi:hypothetical protein